MVTLHEVITFLVSMQISISSLQTHNVNEYVRKSVGNALRDISKKFPELIKAELNNWKLESKEINQVYKLASKLVS